MKPKIQNSNSQKNFKIQASTGTQGQFMKAETARSESASYLARLGRARSPSAPWWEIVQQPFMNSPASC
jgi:hypothetical protein